MDGVGAKELVQVARADVFDRRFDFANGFPDPALGVFRQQQAQDATIGILEGRLDGVEAKEAYGQVFVAGTVIGALGFAAKWRIWSARGKPTGALLVAPRLVKTWFLQGLASTL
ncbi:protein of unknown function [Hyphomicrobium sp. MC1]|nr:protein of unknown function [Hyphomicrobium sp. MC1]